MVPATPHGELKKIIESKAKSANLKIKIVEKSGVKLVTCLKRKYDKTSKNGLCNEKDCLICQHSDKNIRKCRTPIIVYKITCKEFENTKLKPNTMVKPHLMATQEVHNTCLLYTSPSPRD